MAGLFISYSSHDRPWAARLYEDLRARYPTISIFWDRDPASIPPGWPWAPTLVEHSRNSTHFLVFWSEKAKESNEVGPEIQAFMQNRDVHPVRESAKRQVFYVPLEGAYGPLEPLQGFAEFRKNGVYDAAAPGRGTEKLEQNPHKAEWNRLVRVVGDTVMEAEGSQAMSLVLLVMTASDFDEIKGFLPLKMGPGPTGQELLAAGNLTVDAARLRYGNNAFSWRPFGTEKTVIELAEDVRISVNSHLDPAYHFHWVPIDLARVATETNDENLLRNKIEALSEAPFAVVIDPISLIHPVVKNAFARLDQYVKKQHSIVISLAPNQAPAADQLYRFLSNTGAPILDGYFLPPVPATGSFGLCTVDVPHMLELERLIRGSFGVYHLQRKKTEAKPLLASGA